MRDHTKLKAFDLANELVVLIYSSTKSSRSSFASNIVVNP